jgi:hypothetical protein
MMSPASLVSSYTEKSGHMRQRRLPIAGALPFCKSR